MAMDMALRGGGAMAQACSKFPHVYEAPAPGLTGFCQVICPQPGNL